jgi:hypothetical protein
MPMLSRTVLTPKGGSRQESHWPSHPGKDFRRADQGRGVVRDHDIAVRASQAQRHLFIVTSKIPSIDMTLVLNRTSSKGGDHLFFLFY